MSSLGMLSLLVGLSMGEAQAQTPTTSTAKPWTFWWVMGSAFDSTNISRQLAELHQSGLGGVHLIPIYGAKGYEDRFVPFLSDRWLDYLSFITQEAQRLGMGVDVTLGTGWPFGGKHITPQFGAQKIKWQGSDFGTVPTLQKVKRAAPGGEGLVLDHFDKGSFAHYVSPSGFDRLAALPIRAVYNDSYEAFDANWTVDLEQKFRVAKGYELGPWLSLLKPDAPATDTLRRILTDYRELMSDLLLSDFTQPFADWASQRNKIIRNQAHGSPANLLDLYAASHIPETESFGSSNFAIPYVRLDRDYQPSNFGRPNPLAMKFASSAAHLRGRPLVSSETCTWLANHFKVSLSQVKPQLDELFTAGINHVFYHGTTYSPQEAGYPGWLFYASANFGQQSHLWPDMPDLNRYVTACQSILQTSRPDSDLLLYFPIHDLWAEKGNTKAASYPLQMLDVHHTENWLTPSAFGQTAQRLTESGYQFDYLSDRLLQELRLTDDKRIRIGDATYALLLVPPTTQMPYATLQRLHTLSQQGAPIRFLDQLPQKVTGWLDAAPKEEQLRRWHKDFRLTTLEALPLPRPEAFGPLGLSFIRKRTAEGYVYFVANLGHKFTQASIRLSREAASVTRYDPLTGERRLIATSNLIDLELLPGQSIFLLTTEQPVTQQVAPLPLLTNHELLRATWTLRFPSARPLTTDSLTSWTLLGDSTHAYFSGVATYRASFRASESLRKGKRVVLDLGDVRESAEVVLNGKPLGKVWAVPFALEVPKGLLQKNNTIEIMVRNVSANEMIKIDAQRPEWKQFYDINIVDIQYKPLRVSSWQPEASGLLGPIRFRYH